MAVFIIHAQQFSVHTYTTQDGLPSTDVLSLAKDRDNYLWVTTRMGVVRFDGRNFINYVPGDSLKIKNPYFILQDKRGRIWISAKDRIYLMEGKEAWEYFPSVGQKAADTIFSIRETSLNEIVACTNLGQFFYTGKQWEKIRFPGVEDQIVTHVVEAPEGTYYSARNRILFKNTKGAFTVFPVSDTSLGNVTLLRRYRNTLLIRSDSGICTIKNNKIEPLLPGSFRKDRVFDFLVDKQDRLWVILNLNGVWVSQKHNYANLVKKIDVPPFSRAMLEADDAIWICNYQGLLKVKELPVTAYESPVLKNISTLTYDPADSGILAVSPSQGIFRVADEGISPSRNYTFPLRKQFGYDHFYKTALDNKNGLWMISASGTYFYRMKDGELNRFHIPFVSEPLAMDFDPYRKKIVVAATQLLIGDSGGFQPFQYANRKDPITKIYTILPVENQVLVSSKTEGLGHIDENGNYYSLNKELHITAPHQIFEKAFFYKENDSLFWIAYPEEGIRQFKLKNGRLTRLRQITAAQGLTGAVTSLLIDNQARLWVTTETGLSMFEWGKGGSLSVFHQIDKRLDLNIPNWELIMLRKDRAGAIWISNFDRIYRINTAHLHLERPAPPTINIEAIQINSEGRDWRPSDSLSQGFYHIPFSITVPYTQNNISIFFNGVSFADDGELTYAWKLDDRMKPWQQSKNNSISFGDLSPGTYSFLVRARTSNSGWSRIAHFTFTITPPFWETNWFHLLLSFAGAIVVAMIYRFHLRRVTRKARNENRLQRLEMKALKAQMNPHFIYNALNSIQSLVLDNNQKDSLKYISKFSRLLRQTLDSSDTHLVPLSKDLELLELYIQLESLRMNFNFTYNITVSDDVDPEKEMIPPLLIQPYVENALWHGLSEKKGEKQLQLSLSAEDSYIVCKITDNGIGRKRSAELKSAGTPLHASKGMSITSKRLELHNKTAVCNIRITDLFDASGMPAGTEVKLLIKRYDQEPDK